MIESTLEFQFRPSALRSLVEMFCTLPERLRPTHHSLGEDEPGKPIQDNGKFLDSLNGAKLGPFLRGPDVMYDIGLAGTRPIICNCFLDVEPGLAEQFLLHMAVALPKFAFACVPEEREHRNRVIVKQGINTIESWVGRDIEKYIPGFYWLTLLPNTLAEKHGVPISEIEKIAKEHMELEGGQHLFRFYDRPEDWQSTDKVAKLCASLPGVFDVEKIKPQAEATKNFLELDEMLGNWK
ncbi:MAG: hypothetical protein KGJ32_03140 [Xanthomonadaceae bacterium]|nr:hypothetical protein [Xanthomonadaceae bacterium]